MLEGDGGVKLWKLNKQPDLCFYISLKAFQTRKHLSVGGTSMPLLPTVAL